MDPATNPEPLRSVGRYELLFRIASGGMAEVYAARVRGEAGFQKLVAVKRMLPQLADDEEFVTMFLDEAKVAANINSPHCVHTLDLGRADDGSLYIVMELVLGVTLARILRFCARNRRPIPVGVAVDLLGQAAQGLHDAHEATTPLGAPLQIVHRDVSPQNVLVGIDGRVRLTDFGVARAVMRRTETVAGRIKGKFAYCSPEQLMGKDLDRRSDVFALGVVAWEFFTGQRLFVGEHPMETMERVRSMPIPAIHQLRNDVPPALSATIARALERNVSQRTATARDFADELRDSTRGVIPAPTKDQVATFVRSAGGEALTKIQTNIKRALSNRTALAIPEVPGADLTLTPSGVQSAVQTVAVQDADPTDPTTGGGAGASDLLADASVPSEMAKPGDVLPHVGRAQSRSRLPLLGGLLVVLGILVAVGLVFFGGDVEPDVAPSISIVPGSTTSTEPEPPAPPPEAEPEPEVEPDVAEEEIASEETVEPAPDPTPMVRPRRARPRRAARPAETEPAMETVAVTAPPPPPTMTQRATMTSTSTSSTTRMSGLLGLDAFDSQSMR